MFPFNRKPLLEHDDSSPRADRDAFQPLPPPKPFSVALQQPKDMLSTSILDGKNGDGLVIIGKGTSMVGEINNCSRLEIEGSLEGHVVADSVVVRAGGRLKGSVRTERAEVHGTIEGQVSVQEHLDIRSTGQVTGELAYGKLSVAPGGYIAGSIEGYVQTNEQATPVEPPAPLGLFLNGHRAHPVN